MFVRFFKHVDYPIFYSMIPSIKNVKKNPPKNIMNELKKKNFKNYYETREYRQYKPNWTKK